MKLLNAAFALIILASGSTAIATPPPGHGQGQSPAKWDIKAADSRVESYHGRSALFLRDGTAWLKGSHFQNGVIEFDIAFGNAGGFPGIAFRAASRSLVVTMYSPSESLWPRRIGARTT